MFRLFISYARITSDGKMDSFAMNTTDAEVNISQGASKLLKLLRWYAKTYKVVRPKQDKLAKHLQCTARTVKRYCRELREAGFLELEHHANHGANYYLKCPRVVPEFVPEFVPELAQYPLYDFKDLHNVSYEPEVPRMPNQSEVARPTAGRDFENYIGVFLAYGKALNAGDEMAARVLWCTLPIADRLAAMADIQRTAVDASEAKYLPYPATHLSKRPWTRRMAPGVVPMTKWERRDAEVLRLILLAEEQEKSA